MSPPVFAGEPSRVRFPRVSGDEPHLKHRPYLRFVFSPRERG